MQAEAACQHQDQAHLALGRNHVALEIGGRWSQAELDRAMGAGLGTGEAEHAVAVVGQVGGMGAQGAPGGGESFPFGRPPLKTGVTAAAAAAGAHLGPQLADRQLCKKAIHATHGAEVAAPEALFIEPGAHDGAGRNE